MLLSKNGLENCGATLKRDHGQYDIKALHQDNPVDATATFALPSEGARAVRLVFGQTNEFGYGRSDDRMELGPFTLKPSPFEREGSVTPLPPTMGAPAAKKN